MDLGTMEFAHVFVCVYVCIYMYRDVYLCKGESNKENKKGAQSR